MVEVGVLEGKVDVCFAPGGEVISRCEEFFKLLKAFGGEGGEEVFFCGEVFVGGVWADVDSSGDFSEGDFVGALGFENGEGGGDEGISEVAVVVFLGAFGM